MSKPFVEELSIRVMLIVRAVGIDMLCAVYRTGWSVARYELVIVSRVDEESRVRRVVALVALYAREGRVVGADTGECVA